MRKTITPGLTTSDLNSIRSDFPHIKEGYTYLNHASVSPLSTSVKSAVDWFLHTRNRGPVADFDRWKEIHRETKELIRALINARDVNQITYTSNTSDGISIIAESLKWQNGDEIILNDLEFPANVQPYRAMQHKGIRIKYIESSGGSFSPEQIENAISPRTRVISLSAVQYLSGFKSDLKRIGEICRRNNILFVVDAIQALGQVSIDVQDAGIDALATGSHKWLMAPMGIGFLYISDRLMDNLQPSRTGWLSVEKPWDLLEYEQSWDKTAGRFELGTMNMIGITGLHASIEKFFKTGMPVVEHHIHSLARHAIGRLSGLEGFKLYTPVQPEQHGGIVSFSVPTAFNTEEFVRTLMKDKIIISERESHLRIAPHFYNTKEEINVVFERIETFL